MGILDDHTLAIKQHDKRNKAVGSQPTQPYAINWLL